MSFFTRLFSASSEPADTVRIDPAGSVLSATGLGRRALADLFRRDGLFGAESDLAPVEQAIVQSRLGRIPGLASRPVLAPTDARLVALENFTDAVVLSGTASRAERAQLEAAGYDAAQVSEVVRVVRIARDVFGPVRHSVAIEPARAANRDRYAHAA